MILIDSNVVIDLLQASGEWQEWSENAVVEASADDEIAISQIVVAEVAPRLGSLGGFIERIEQFGGSVLELTNEAAFDAGVAFNSYRARRRDGPDTVRLILPDFLIGGHAQTLGASILTRDPRFYSTYFPSVPLITPDEAST
jgi:predicted nucleic acid-binding protein